jgi:glycosyltransferase involved in cell wall biosynthesis
MRVLYLNHTGEMSGAERALMDLLEVLPRDQFDPLVACPTTGRLSESVARLGIPVVGVPEVRISFRLHPWRTGQGLAQLMSSAMGLAGLARRHSAGLIHANSTRAGLIAGLAASLGGPTVLVHLHDCLPSSRAGHLTRRVIGGSAAVVVANSRHTAANFAAPGCRADLRVVHYSVDSDRFKPGGVSKHEARLRLGLPARAPVLGMVAQLTPWKGQDDAISLLASLRSSRPGAHLLLAGTAQFTSGFSRYDNLAYEQSLRSAVSRLGLEDAVHFLGRRDDLPEILPALDLLILPSWEEPFGIVLLEAMAMQLPVVATSVGGPADIITDGQDGFLLAPRQPLNWAREIDSLLAQPKLLAAVGRRARLRALADFSRSRYLAGILASYSEALGRRAKAA